MKILVTNDDGVEAPGLWKMVGALKSLGEVVVAAPDRDQSGIGSARTLLDVVKVREVTNPPIEGIKTFAIEGTPADCVILAVEMLSPGKFDIVLSGINEGSNLGMDILVSGTVGAAIQGYYREMHSHCNVSRIHHKPAIRRRGNHCCLACKDHRGLTAASHRYSST